MFGRRVASSCRIPASMYTRLRISSPRQANRMLPPLISVSTLVGRSVSGGANTFASLATGSESVPSDLASPSNLLSLLSMSPQALLGVINASPLLLRTISDTMCTYSVLVPHRNF
ncbi:putative mitochondrial hypothetical protein [Leptomonas pyrrhocoris]|uniref:Uncharacterized protein n=1 Tax=Leptomonas pyrrhocoris TaxID=157538 RepID=A0A0M9G5T5_LEPPY|nr:putative mitochondrial hypothetical protein [Leptomonas pyrrhocoris]KPA82943.1 putative mitochondrial hypothetical protein [Leptomonas pyrrhocoris]|eukprot:XP_015661382.1 putative mitochondrial hypothetical protein [Leptomonas pyrrhocoris]